jgi:RND family efflux transporter MFP subunit
MFSFARCLAGLALLGLAGLAFGEGPKRPRVPVVKPVEREVTDYEELTGRLEASALVEVRATMSGTLVAAHYKAGSEVKKGDLLFTLDDREAKLKMARAEAELGLAEARLKKASADHAAALKLLPARAISREDFDKIVAARDEANAALQLARVGIDAARLALGSTRITAPIDGRIGRALVSPGNQVSFQAGHGTLLAVLVQLDPVFARFEVDERTLLRLRRLGRAGKLGPIPVPVFLGLIDEEGCPHKGVFDHAEPMLNLKTGTLGAFASFPNPKKLYSHGMFARVRLPAGLPRKALLVPDSAVGTVAGGTLKYVLVVNDKNVVVRAPVTVGQLHDGLRVVEKGLTPEQWVVVGPAEVRPGEVVEPERGAKKE